MDPFDFQPRTRVIFGAGSISRLGEIARELNFQKTLLVADRGMIESGHVDEALAPLRKAGIRVSCFHDFEVNPDTKMVQAGMEYATPFQVDSIIGLGGGSSLDCAKGINFLLTNGGEMRDYVGYGKATKPLLPMIAVPTTAGTGSEAQSYALISDPDSHQKMACGDPKAAFEVALLDPLLTLSQPRAVTATSGFDAIAHAVETYVTTKRNGLSEFFSREAWRLLDINYELRIAESGRRKGARRDAVGSLFCRCCDRELHARRYACMCQSIDCALRNCTRRGTCAPAAFGCPLERHSRRPTLCRVASSLETFDWRFTGGDVGESD